MDIKMTSTARLKVYSYEELRDSLHISGIFDMLDCKVAISCPAHSDVEELERMILLLESTINVVDIAVHIDSNADEYDLRFEEVSTTAAEGLED
jgi:hypothetical protein